jgi:hypothetical protein
VEAAHCTAAAGVGTVAAAEQSRGAERLKEGEEWEETSKGSYVQLKRSRGLTVKQKSPLTQSSKEKVPKIKVVEFFKLYKNALGLKFKSSKFIALQDRFCIKVNLNYLDPYQVEFDQILYTFAKIYGRS